MGPVPDGATARSAGGLPEVGQHAVFRAPDECLRCMGPSWGVCNRPVLECVQRAHLEVCVMCATGPSIHSEVCVIGLFGGVRTMNLNKVLQKKA